MTKDKKNKKTDDLIDQLCGELEATKPRSPYVSIIIWMLVSLAYLALVVGVIGLRMDMDIKLTDSVYLFEMGLALSIFITAALASSWLSFPDCLGRPWIVKIPLTFSFVFLMWVVAKSVEEGIIPEFELHLKHCAHEGLYMEILPLVAIILLAMKGRTTQPYWSMVMNILAVSTLGWIGLRMTCAMDEMGHSLFNHLLPFAIVAAAIGLFARKLFKW